MQTRTVYIRSFVILLALLAHHSVRADALPLSPLPARDVVEMAPLLRDSDAVLLESDDHGWQRQITTMTLVAASPQAVRDDLPSKKWTGWLHA